jgi:hypothetical protein
MSQNIVNGLVFGGNVGIADGANLDAFSRLRVSNPVGRLDGQFTYDLQPLLFQQLTNGTGASIAHDSTNRAAALALSSSPNGSYAIMESYEWFRYEAGRGKLVFITFNMGGAAANVIKFAQFGDANNGYGFQTDETGNYFYILSGTTLGDQVIEQADWNIDKLDGSGASGLTLDLTKEAILVIDYQALYVGRVRMGFDIGGNVVYCHQFTHANEVAYPYIQIAGLPIRVGMICNDTATATMRFNCASVIDEGGTADIGGYEFSVEGTGSAGNTAWAHILSIRPKTTFNSIANRTKFVPLDIDILVTGNSSIIWELCIGQAITGTTTFNDINTAYCSYEYNIAGTISGSPSIVIARGYVASSATAKGTLGREIASRYPITLDSAGAVRSLGTLSLNAYGVSAASAMRATLNFREVR